MEAIPRNVHSAFLCTSTTLPDSCSASSLLRATSSCSHQAFLLVMLQSCRRAAGGRCGMVSVLPWLSAPGPSVTARRSGCCR